MVRVLTVSSIDGVLVRSNDPLPNAYETLNSLQQQRIPFILLTNGGGKSEEERVATLSEKLQVPLDTSMFVQSHTPFADLEQYKSKTVLVMGGDDDKCRHVAEKCVSMVYVNALWDVKQITDRATSLSLHRRTSSARIQIYGRSLSSFYRTISASQGRCRSQSSKTTHQSP